MSASTPAKSENHLVFLDSARGIASMMVLFMHFFDREYHGQDTATYIKIFCNGNDAVSFFFVLSGFVLAYKYTVLNKAMDIKQFFVSRFFRLWPAYFITVLVSALWVLYAIDSFNWNSVRDIFILNNNEFWEEVPMVRFHNKFYFPGWTLAMEMVGSFFIPFFVLISFKSPKLLYYLCFVFIVVAGSNFFYSVHFIIGVLISCNYKNINREYFETKRWFKYRYLFIIAAFLVFPLRHIETLSPFGPTYTYLAAYLGIDIFLYTALCSMVFLICILYNKKLQRMLSGKVLVFVGKLSFSLYLVHPLAINMVYDFIARNNKPESPALQLLEKLGLFIAVALVLAYVMHRLFELPFIKLGKKVTAKMKPSIVISRGAPATGGIE